MPVPFFVATAEQLVAVVEAVVARNAPADREYVAQFTDMQADQAESALNLAVDLGLLVNRSGFEPTSPLARPLASANEIQRAAALRIIVESYRPFVAFRERLPLASSAATAAHQVKILLELAAHRDAIRDTLVSLGTYSQSLRTEGGGRYRPTEAALQNELAAVAKRVADLVAAEAAVRDALGEDASAVASRDDVIIPLAEALLRGSTGDSTGAVTHAGNAVESFLVEVAHRQSVSLTGATGINAKLEKLKHPVLLPTKLVFMGKYLGHIRNAADHGIDSDVGLSWQIRESTGREYPFVACSFIANVVARESRRPAVI